MIIQNKTVVVGGDARSRFAAEYLADSGFAVLTYGLGDLHIPGCRQADDFESSVEGAETVILPTPSFINDRLFCPLGENEPPDRDRVFRSICPEARIFGGRLTEGDVECAKCFGHSLSDYMKLEDVIYQNAVITAEGALMLAMEAIPETLCGAKVAVLGFGRIGEALTRRLVCLGANVSVAVRKEKDFERVKDFGVVPIRIFEGHDDLDLSVLCQGYRVIFNTVPARILSDEVIAGMDSQAVLIELASEPGGWDANIPMPCHQIRAPGLPGKYAPQSAGRVIADALTKRLREVIP